MQEMYSLINGAIKCLEIPDPDVFVLPEIRWGAFDELFTPAYWRGQAWQHQQLGTYECFRLGRTLEEELAACLLGGFGMKAELGLAAFSRLLERGLLQTLTPQETFRAVLSEDFDLYGRPQRYRFPNQKARYLAESFNRLACFVEPEDDLQLRDCLSEFPGVGLKTASWIVRNYRSSNKVAVIDVHILRAGRHIGIFRADLNPQRHYRALEDAFIQFAAAIDIAASLLDALMWDYMRCLASAASSTVT